MLADGFAFGAASGFADTALKTRLTPSDRLLQGSVGKTYVAAVALQLVHEGRFALDDRVSKYLGNELWYGRLANGTDITIRQLMNHTSGVARYEFKPEFTRDLTASPDKSWAPAELIAYLARWAKALYEGRAFDPSLLPQMLDGVPARLGRDARYGLGVILRPTPLGMTWGHSGFFPGYLTEVMYFPDTKLAIAVQVNTSVQRSFGGSPTRFVLAVAQALAARAP